MDYHLLGGWVSLGLGEGHTGWEEWENKERGVSAIALSPGSKTVASRSSNDTAEL